MSPLLGAIDTLYKCRKLMVLAPVIGSLLHPVWLRNQSFRHEGEDVKAVERDGWGSSVAEREVLVVSQASAPRSLAEAPAAPASQHLGQAAQVVVPLKQKIAAPDKIEARTLEFQKNVLTLCLVLEAGGEENPVRDMTAIMNVIQNRTYNQPQYFYNAVVTRLQFSCFINVDTSSQGELLELIKEKQTHSQWKNARRIVDLACEGKLKKDMTGGATHYLNPVTAQDQSWRKSLRNTVWIGRHFFGKTRISEFQRGLTKPPQLSAEAFRRSGPKRTIEPEGLR